MRLSRLAAIKRSVVSAKGTPLLDETAWGRGKREAVAFANQRPIMFMIIAAPFFGAAGANLLPFQSVLARSLVGGVVGLTVALLVVLAIAGYFSVRALFVQRKEARTYARALEVHIHVYEQWAKRREIADDFKDDILRHEAPRITKGPLEETLAHEEDRWRGRMINVGAQIQSAGRDVSDFVATQLASLADDDNNFGDDDRARIRNSMYSCSQNLWSIMRSEPPPTTPEPPADGNAR